MEEHKEVKNSQSPDLLTGVIKAIDSIELKISQIKDKLEAIGLKQESAQPSLEYHSDYFISQECEFIYYLAVLDGDAQTKALGIAPSFYKDKEKAKSWRDQIVRKIHPDRSKHPYAGKATEALNSLYKRMLKNAK